jgi:hypothetical protein
MVPQNRGGHGIPEAILIQELTNAGFQLERVINHWWLFPDRRHCVGVSKALAWLKRLLVSRSHTTAQSEEKEGAL